MYSRRGLPVFSQFSYSHFKRDVENSKVCGRGVGGLERQVFKDDLWSCIVEGN